MRLTDERLTQIASRREMRPLVLQAIKETLAEPEAVVRSITDPDAKLHDRRYATTSIGDRLLCVVVAEKQDDAFVLTAYLTDRRTRGELIWAPES